MRCLLVKKYDYAGDLSWKKIILTGSRFITLALLYTVAWVSALLARWYLQSKKVQKIYDLIFLTQEWLDLKNRVYNCVFYRFYSAVWLINTILLNFLRINKSLWLVVKLITDYVRILRYFFTLYNDIIFFNRNFEKNICYDVVVQSCRIAFMFVYRTDVI